MKKISLILIITILVSCFFVGCVSETPDTSTFEPDFNFEDSTPPASTPKDDEPATTCSHIFSQVTCTEPETCRLCGETRGKATGHDWLAASCITPKTCSSCGTTEGSAAGHSWIAATCAAAKTCSVCGKIEGKALGHTYADGKCKSCGQADPTYTQTSMVWIPKSGKKYHNNPNCSNMKNPSQVSKSSAIAQGFTACKKCY